MLRYMHRLAERLSMTVDTLAKTMTHEEIRRWIAMDNLDSIQSEIAKRMGVSMSELVNATDAETMIGMVELERSTNG